MDAEAAEQRYRRQLDLAEIGPAGQARLGAARVLLVGAGGLGAPAAFYLAAAGVGALGVVDYDVVDLSNLQRQILYRTADVGALKARCAAGVLQALNPGVRVVVEPRALDADNALALIAGYDFVVDATDSLATKFLIADACHFARKPYSHAGIQGFLGQTLTVLPGETACYRCVFGAPPPPEDPPATVRGPLGALPGVIGAIQATEALKQILGIGRLLTDRLLVYDALTLTFREVAVQRHPQCPLCGSDPRLTSLHD